MSAISRSIPYRFAAQLTRFMIAYVLFAVPVAVVLALVPLSARIQLLILQALAALALPFLIVPLSRWLTKLTFSYMKRVNRGNVPVSETSERVELEKTSKGFLTHLVEQNAAVALIRVAYIVAVTILVAKVTYAWIYLIQDHLFQAEASRIITWARLLRFGLSFIGAVVIGGCFGAVAVIITVRLFNYVTRYHNDFYEIQEKRNLAVASIYAALVLSTFFVCSDLAPRVLALLMPFSSI